MMMQFEEFKKQKGGLDNVSNYSNNTKKQKQAAMVTRYEEIVDNRQFNYAKLDKNLEIKKQQRRPDGKIKPFHYKRARQKTYNPESSIKGMQVPGDTDYLNVDGSVLDHKNILKVRD